MKYLFTTTVFAFCLFPFYSNAQVAIGKETVNGISTVLDFNDLPNNSKGLILPSVDSVPVLTADNNGTFLFDKTDKKVKMYENGAWVSLSNAGNSSLITANNTVESGTDQGVIIGSNTSSAKGILVLESQNKAMLLPKINTPHTAVKSPYPGMMCYDTASQSVVVFDGSNWNYWK